jgi:hypothetical protein
MRSSSRPISRISLEETNDFAPPMKDYKLQLEKLRSDAAECALVRDLATDKAKREMFDRLALHLDQLADEVERAMNARKTS